MAVSLNLASSSVEWGSSVTFRTLLLTGMGPNIYRILRLSIYKFFFRLYWIFFSKNACFIKSDKFGQALLKIMLGTNPLNPYIDCISNEFNLFLFATKKFSFFIIFWLHFTFKLLFDWLTLLLVYAKTLVMLLKEIRNYFWFLRKKISKKSYPASVFKFWERQPSVWIILDYLSFINHG